MAPAAIKADTGHGGHGKVHRSEFVEHIIHGRVETGIPFRRDGNVFTRGDKGCYFRTKGIIGLIGKRAILGHGYVEKSYSFHVHGQGLQDVPGTGFGLCAGTIDNVRPL